MFFTYIWLTLIFAWWILWFACFQSCRVHTVTQRQWMHVKCKKEETASVHTCKGLQRGYNKHSRPSFQCKSPYHQVSISCSHVYVHEGACVFTSLFYNLARSISQSGSNRVAGEEEGKLTDRLRHSQYIIHLLSERELASELIKICS